MPPLATRKRRSMMNDSNGYKRRTMEAYNTLARELAEGYDHHFEFYARLEADHMLSGLSRGSTILDLGCGVGTASRYFAEQGCKPVSADLSEAMLKECQRRGLSSLIRLDLERLPFLCSSFDAVWAHTSLIHIPKHRLVHALEGLQRILKPGGALFIALREGAQEGYEGNLDTQRWFSNFQAAEFESYVPSVYRIERSTRMERGVVTFLNYHLVKVEGER